MASITKHGDRWRAQVARKGTRKSAIWPTRREAQAWAQRVEAEIDAQQTRGKTLGEACRKYLDTVSPTKKNAVLWESRRLDALIAYFGDDAPLETIGTEALGQWRDKRLETVSGSTVVREVNLYRNLFRLAVREWRWVTTSPFEGLRLPRENPAREPVWSWQLIKRLLRANRSGKTAEMQQAFRIALHTGLRLQEVLTCTYDERRQVLVLPISKTESKPVMVPVPRRARKLLQPLPEFTVGANEGSALFSRLSRELLVEGLTFHDTRATALTLLARRMDVMTLARISRHHDLNLLLARYYRETASSISARL